MSDGFLLAIPVFNEERYVARVLAEAAGYCRHILVVDDGSTDRTPELLREFIRTTTGESSRPLHRSTQGVGGVRDKGAEPIADCGLRIQYRDSHGAADQNRDSHGAANQYRDSHGAAIPSRPLHRSTRGVGGVKDEGAEGKDNKARGKEATRPPRVRVIRHRQNIGYGKCLADAFDFARKQGYDWLITMDCDLQHEPSYLPRFMAAAACDDADIISGTRYPEGRLVDDSAPADRREVNRRITRIINDRLGLRITDAFCGFKAYRVAALAHLRATVPGYAMPVQLWVQAARAGLRVDELTVPLIYHDPTRCFGGVLDDPAVRLEHYLEVLETELAKEPSDGDQASRRCVPCR